MKRYKLEEQKYRAYGSLVKLLKRDNFEKAKFNYIYAHDDSSILKMEKMNLTRLNGILLKEKHIRKSQVFFGENTVEAENESSINFDAFHSWKANIQNADTISDLWIRGIESAKVPEGWKNSGYYLVSYIKENKKWALSSWIWTSSAIARCYCAIGKIENAKDIADAFLRDQLTCGGWIVRYGHLDGKFIRIVAPNDSAFIARNALINVYKVTKEQQYLDGATRCADWIISECHNDGALFFALDFDRNFWIKDRNIVDIGFTAALFADLYEITANEKYLSFLKLFIKSYIDTFYDKSTGFFNSYVRGEKRLGGYFSRGQAWALEGLIPAYKILRDNDIKNIIDRLISNIISHQIGNGGWPCNFQWKRYLMGEDCKGIGCLAKALLDWTEYSKKKNEKIIFAVKRALSWCIDHTDPSSGYILSFNMDGAIEHNKNASASMLYANAYCIEIYQKLRNL